MNFLDALDALDALNRGKRITRPRKYGESIISYELVITCESKAIAIYYVDDLVMTGIGLSLFSYEDVRATDWLIFEKGNIKIYV